MKRKSLLLLATAGASLIPGMAVAQESSQISPRAGAQAVSEIVVTATKRETTIFDVPGTVSAIFGDDLQRQGGTSLSNIADLISGISINGVGPGALVAIRGVSTSVGTPGSAQPNAIYVDGVYNSDGTVLANRYPDIERVEVLKGPQGTLFGRNATGGAIQVITRNPTFDWTADLNLDGGYYTGAGSSASSPHANARGFVSGPIVPNLLAFSLAGGYDYIRGFYHDDGTGGKAGRSHDSYLRGKLKITPSENFTIVLSGVRIRRRGQYNTVTYLRDIPAEIKNLLPFSAPRLNNIASFFPGTIIASKVWHVASDNDVDPNSNVFVVRQTGFSARSDLELDIGTLTSVTGYIKTFNRYGNNSPSRGTPACRAFPPPTGTCINASYSPIISEFSQEFDFASRDVGVFSVIAGLNYYQNKGTATAALLNLGDPPSIKFPVLMVRTKVRSYAAFGEATARLADDLNMVLGLRYTTEPHNDLDLLGGVTRKKTFSSITPKISLKYNINKTANIYATFSEGRTAGLTGVTNAGKPNDPYAPVDSEVLRAYELGLKYKSTDVQGNVSLFYYDYKNKQEYVNNLAPFVVNTGPVRLFGIDADILVNLTKSLNLSGGLSYIPYAKYRDFPSADIGIGVPFDVTDRRLARAPKLTATGTLSYFRGPLDASLTIAYSSKFYLDVANFLYQPQYVRINGSLGYQINDSIRVGVYGRNLTNRKVINGLQLLQSNISTRYDPPQEVGLTLGFRY